MTAASKNSFSTRATLRVGKDSFEIYRLDALASSKVGNVARLPFSLKVLLENLLRHEDERFVHADDIRALAAWDPLRPRARPKKKFRSCRRACCCRISRACRRWSTSRRCATRSRNLGGDPKKINPLLPAELVIDHSVQVDKFGTANAFAFNAELEMQRNIERYAFLRWGQKSAAEFSRWCRRTPASATR